MGLFKKSKRETELERQYNEEIKKMVEEEEELEKQIPEEELNIFELLKEKDKDLEEVNAYLTEEDLEEEKAEERYVKRLTITSIAFLVLIAGGLISGLIFLHHYLQSDLVKVTIPAMEKYYSDKYGISGKIEEKNIKEICYEDRNETGERVEVCTGKKIAVFNDGTYIITTDDETFSDNKSIGNVINSYNSKLKEYLTGVEFIGNESILSYKDFYDTYNSFLPYINILPNGKSFDELYETGKLTVRDVIFYQGDLNFDNMANFLNKLSDDTSIVFINSLRGLPSQMTIYKDKTFTTINLGVRNVVDEYIAYYELDNAVNGISGLEIKNVDNKNITKTHTYDFSNSLKIYFEKQRVNRDEPEKLSYYFVELSSGNLSFNNIVQFNADSRSSDYREIDSKEYRDLYHISLGGVTYLIGNTPIGFGNKLNNKNSKCFLEFC